MISSASRRPSGENAGLVQAAGVARSVLTPPARSTQETGKPLLMLTPARYASVPLLETDSCAAPADPPLALLATPSRTGTDGPEVSSRPRSNGAANSVPSWT